jgi:DNA repair protein RadA/Sms
VNAEVPAGYVAIGEVGLAGEIRRIPGLDRRLAEAARLGFTDAIVPAEPGEKGSRTVQGLKLHPVPTIVHALASLGLARPHRQRSDDPPRSEGRYGSVGPRSSEGSDDEPYPSPPHLISI